MSTTLSKPAAAQARGGSPQGKPAGIMRSTCPKKIMLSIIAVIKNHKRQKTGLNGDFARKLREFDKTVNLWVYFLLKISKVIQEMAEEIENKDKNGVSTPKKKHFPEIEDPTDLRIMVTIEKFGYDITDSQIGQKINLSRQSVNARRKSLEKMGYKVRV